MALAFQCDLCGFLEPGHPIVKHDIKGTDPDRPQLAITEEWCMECLGSFRDWREARTPIMDDPHDGDEDATDEVPS